jgi:arylsulfatase A-like enzyme
MLASTLMMSLVAAAFGASPPKPNIIFILADDLGYMDIGANNPKTFYETPNIDRLASRGMRFTAGYAACPVCSPTRASIMTGKYPPRTRITTFIGRDRVGKLLPAPNQDHLDLEEVTIAEALRDGGYTNFFAGKWHLGAGPFSPNAQGFGPGLEGNAQFYYPPSPVPPPNAKDDPKTTDRIALEAVRFINENKARPFFAYLPFLAVHVPIGARPDLVAKYERKQASAPPDAWGRERSSNVRQVQNHAAYAAMLEQMDGAIGRVVAALEQNGILERTVIVFTSDNGGLSTAEGHPTANVPLRGGKGWLYEGGIREPWIICAPGVTRPGSVCDVPVVSMDFYPTLLELAGLPLRPRQHCDAVSLVPLLKGGTLARGPLFWHFPHYGNQGGAPGGAIREGDWKLIEWYEDGSLELFNLRTDLAERHNLAAAEPAKAKALHAKLSAWRQEANAVMPTPNPDYKPGTDAEGAVESRAKPQAGSAALRSRPNIVLLYGDDIGYGDFSCYGATGVTTPNVDRLAREGLRFTGGYSAAATCTPSRYALLTGEYAFRKQGTGVLPGDAALVIEPGRATLPSTLRQAGYRTAAIGKWHLGLGEAGKSLDWNGEIKPGPPEVGFDYSFIMAATGDRVPCVYIENRRVVGHVSEDPIFVNYKEAYPGEPTGTADRDRLKLDWSHGHNQAVVNGIGRIGYMKGGKAVLWKDEDMADVFTKQALGFIEREKDRPFFLYFATHDIHVPRVPHPRFAGKSSLGPRGDAIVEFDDCVGRILDKLEQLKLAPNTLVIVSSDNGPVLDDGYKDFANEKLGGHKPAGRLRAGKYSLFEGGTRVPLITRWPGRIKPGVSEALISQVDFAATLAALVGRARGSGAMPDSLNLLPALLGESSSGRDHVVEHTNRLALRVDQWKFIPPGQVRDGLGPWQQVSVPAPGFLFDLAADPGETRDTAAANPERVRQLSGRLEQIRGAVPLAR